MMCFVYNLAPVVQRLDNAIQRINHYPVDKYWQNKPRYPLDSDLSGGHCYPAFEQPGPGGSLDLMTSCENHLLVLNEGSKAGH